MANEWDAVQQAIADLRVRIDALCDASSTRLSGRDITVVTRLHGHEDDLASDVRYLRRCLT